MAQKPSIPKGTRDFGPDEMRKRNYIMEVIEQHFKRSGFEPISTPAFENLDTLMGKYGDEGDRLVFKILNSGDFLSKYRSDAQSPLDDSLTEVTRNISKKALRYDLTVPFARYVVQHHHELPLPFKRYQIQPVWRADRPQKGRFQEFFQCDADVVGSTSLWQEIELIELYLDVFDALGIDATVRINHRGILAGIAQTAGIEDFLVPMTVALDKLDKIGADGVRKEWSERGLSGAQIDLLAPLLAPSHDFGEALRAMDEWIGQTDAGQRGLEALQFIANTLPEAVAAGKIQLDVSLARGLDYYTGAIFEVVANQVEMGSIGGGGRYDDLTGVFGMSGLSGVGISFGLERIYLVLEELNAFPPTTQQQTVALFANFGPAEARVAHRLVRELRAADVAAELYPDAAKLKKQLTYADKKNIPLAILIGTQEVEQSEAVVKNLSTGEQENVPMGELVHRIKAHLNR